MSHPSPNASSRNQKYKLLAGLTVAIVAVAAAGAYFAMSATREQKKPNIFVILVDTLRADHLGIYGYSRDTSPTIDAFAKESLVATRAITAAPWTPSSVASLFSGMYVSAHGWHPPAKRSEFSKTGMTLASAIDTLAERLKRVGYTTGAISPNPWITPQFGFGQGFDGFWTRNRADAEDMTKRAKSALRMTKKEGSPVFLYIHYLDPHDPYKPPQKYRGMFTGSPPPGTYPEHVHQSMNNYDGEIRYTDDMIGEFFRHLKEQGLYEDSLIVFIADHGEQFYEKGDLGHGHQLFQEETHVPLIVKLPGSSKVGTIESTVSSVDVLPTLVSLAGAGTTEGLPGISLLDEAALSAREGVLSEIKRDYAQRSFVTPEGRKIIYGSPKKIDEGQAVQDTVVGLFDLTSDALEQKPIETVNEVESMKEKLSHALAEALEKKVVSDKGETKVDEETIKQLKSLGYIQ